MNYFFESNCSNSVIFIIMKNYSYFQIVIIKR